MKKNINIDYKYIEIEKLQIEDFQSHLYLEGEIHLKNIKDYSLFLL